MSSSEHHTPNPAPDGSVPEDVVIQGHPAKKPKEWHGDSGISVLSSIAEIFTGTPGASLAGSLTRRIAFDSIPGTLTYNIRDNVQSYSAAHARSSNTGLFNELVTAGASRVAGKVISAAPLAIGYAGSVGSALRDKDKFVAAHKALIKEMAAGGVPGFEYQAATINGQRQEIFIDASSTGQSTRVSPIVYGPSGPEAKHVIDGLSAHAINAVETFINDARDHISNDREDNNLATRQDGINAYNQMVTSEIAKTSAPAMPPVTADANAQPREVLSAPAPAGP